MYGSLLEDLQSGRTVVTANNRLARTLRSAFDRAQQDRSLQVWNSPNVLSWFAWQRQLWDETRLRGGAARSLELLDDAAAGLLWQRVIARCEPTDSDLPLAAFARNAQAAWRLLHDWRGLDGEEWAAAGLTPDQQAFLRWSGEYRQSCLDSGWADSAQLSALLSSDISQGLLDDLPAITFAGFDEWSPAREELRAGLASRGVDIRVHTPAIRPEQARRGCPAGNAVSELSSAAVWSRAAFEARPDAVIGVVIPDLAARADEVRRVFNDVFAPGWRVQGLPGGMPLNISYGKPLAELPVVHTALALMRLADGRAEFNAFSLLLRSVWVDGGREEAAQRAQLEIELRDKVRREFSLDEVVFYCERQAPRFAGILSGLIESAADRQLRDAPEWAHWLTALLQTAGWPGTESPDSETWQTLQAWNRLLSQFAACKEMLGSMSRAAALRALTQLAQQQLFQPEGHDSGVQVLGVLEAAGHEFDHLWICGMARELWPPPVKPNPFIPLMLQRRLKMPDNSSLRALDFMRGLTQRLMGGASDVVVSWPQQQDGEALGPSPLTGIEQATLADPVEAVPTWTQQLFNSISLQSLTTDPPPAFVTQGIARGGAALLRLQAVSPLNAFIEKRLGAHELSRPPTGISAMERGNLTHKALEQLYRAYPNRSALAGLSVEQRQRFFTEVLQKAVKQLPGAKDPLIQRLSVLEIKQQLQRLLLFLQLELERPEFTVIEVEARHEAKIGSLIMRLTLDRLDELAGGQRIVIDYKTGRVSRRNWNPDTPGDLQLPLYVTAIVPDASALSFAQIAAQNIGYDGVGASGIGIAGIREPGAARGKAKFCHPYTDTVIESWDELRSAWKVLLNRLADEFVAGDFRLDPKNPDSARGQFAVLSRIYDDSFGYLEELE